MNPQSHCRYTHTDRTRVFRDVRSKPMPEITQEQCYFLGFRISVEHAYRYHDALVLADDHDSLLVGIAKECEAIHDGSPETYARDIALVFVRNLKMNDPQMIGSVDSCNITTEIQKTLSRRDDNQFTVVGMLGEGICLVNEKASDALAAIQHARCQGANLAGKDFMPLEVCQAHPVTKEFDALFDTVAKRIMALVGSVSTEGGYVH